MRTIWGGAAWRRFAKICAIGALFWAGLAGCDPEPEGKAGGGGDAALIGVDSDAALVALPAPRLLRRMSLDLRGVLPTAAELDEVEAAEAAEAAGTAGATEAKLAEIRDRYLDDPRLEGRVVAMLAERWHTLVDSYLISWWEYPDLTEEEEYRFERSVGEEPLRLMARIVAEDGSWRRVVTEDHTLADPMLPRIWPIDRPDAEPPGSGPDGWYVARYTDGRPPAGVLATNGLWWRYYSTVSNLNRSRAAAISRLLLCEDYLGRPVSLSAALVEGDAGTGGEATGGTEDTAGTGGKNSLPVSGIEQEIRSNDACLACHSSVDPLASALFGFWPMGEYNIDEASYYHPERERMGELNLGTGPVFAGHPIEGLAELGQRIAADPRFARCGAESFASMLWRRPVVTGDFDRINGLAEAFEAADLRPKPLIRAVTDSAVYRAGSLTADAPEAQLDQEVTARLLTAPLLAEILADLGVSEWEAEGFDLLRSDTTGYRVLGGGVDGDLVQRPQRDPGLTWVVVVQRAAQRAAAQLVEAQIVGADGYDGSGLFSGAVTEQTAPDDPAFAEELDLLHWRLYGARPDAAWQAQIQDLWQAAATAGGGSAAGWRAVVEAMLRDPMMVLY